MSWPELFLTKDQITQLVQFIHNQEPTYIKGKKYRLMQDSGHKNKPKHLYETQFIRRIRVFYGRNNEEIWLKIIDGEKEIYVDDDGCIGFEEPVFYVNYKTTYNKIIKLSLNLNLKNKIKKIKYCSSQSPLSFLIKDIKIKDIPWLPLRYPKTWIELMKFINKKYQAKSYPENSSERWWCLLSNLPQHILAEIFSYL